MRAKDSQRHELVQTLGEGGWLIRMPVSQRAGRLRQELSTHWQARLIQTSAAASLGASTPRCATPRGYAQRQKRPSSTHSMYAIKIIWRPCEIADFSVRLLIKAGSV